MDQKKSPVLIGYHSKSDYFPFDPVLYKRSEPVYSYRLEQTVKTDRKIDAEFYIETTSYPLVRPGASNATFNITQHTLLGGYGVLSGKVNKRTEHPGHIKNVRYSRYLGQSQGIYPTVDHHSKEESTLFPTSENVDPFRYISYSLPQSIRKNEIGLLCVREG